MQRLKGNMRAIRRLRPPCHDCREKRKGEREQRTGRRSTTTPLQYAPGEMAGSLTGELAYDIRDSIPGNVVRSKALLCKRMPFWYLDLVRRF